MGTRCIGVHFALLLICQEIEIWRYEGGKLTMLKSGGRVPEIWPLSSCDKPCPTVEGGGIQCSSGQVDITIYVQEQRQISLAGESISLKLSLLVHRYKPLTCHLPEFVLLLNGNGPVSSSAKRKSP